MNKVTAHYLLFIVLIRLNNFQTGIISLVNKNPADLCTKSNSGFKLIQQKWFYSSETISQKVLDLKETNVKKS